MPVSETSSPQSELALLRFDCIRRDGDIAFPGEFHRIADKIDERSLERVQISLEMPRRARRDVQTEPQVPLAHLNGKHPPHVVEGCVEVELRRHHASQAGFHPREIENRIDQPQQRLSRAGDRARHIALLGIEVRFSQKVAQTNNGVQRCSQFVADTGDEQALRAARRFRLALRFRQFRDEARYIERKNDQADEKTGAEREVCAPEITDGDNISKPDDRHE